MIDVYKKTTSGILVVNKDGHPFITVATHGFEADGLVYHPNPVTGSVIGRIIEHLPGTDISVMKLNTGLRYTNHMFGSEVNPDGIETSGISPGYPPHLRTYDFITMDNPYSGFSEGSVLATGYKFSDGGTEYVRHSWDVFENGSELIDGSCGCPILDEQGMVVGLFRFKVGGYNLRFFSPIICRHVATGDLDFPVHTIRVKGRPKPNPVIRRPPTARGFYVSPSESRHFPTLMLT
jgi:hypothetical protein